MKYLIDQKWLKENKKDLVESYNDMLNNIINDFDGFEDLKGFDEYCVLYYIAYLEGKIYDLENKN